MRELYSIEALADVRIENVEGIVHGRYLDFNISILNEGLVGADNVTLWISTDGERIDLVEMGGVEVGFGRTLKVENMKIPRNVETLEFVLDAGEGVREMEYDNNVAEMSV